MPSDSDSLRRIQEGDQAAWKALYEKYFPIVWRHAYLRAGSRDVAEDVTSECFLALIDALKQGKLIDKSIAGWLFTVANRRLADRGRERGKADRHERLQPPRLHDDERGEDLLLRQELRGQVIAVLDQLADDVRLALEWKYIDKLTVAEIATRMRESEKAIESLLYRGRQSFRALLPANVVNDDARGSSHGQ